MSTDLERQIHSYASFLDSTLPTFEADEVIEGEIETQAVTTVRQEEKARPRRGWVIGVAAAAALLIVMGGVAALSGLLGDSSSVASGSSPMVVAARYYEAYNARDGAALADLFADDIVLSFPGIAFGPYVGKDEVLAEQLAEITSPGERLITLSDPVVEANTVRGAHSLEVPGHLYTATIEVVVEEGKISRMTITLDEESIEEMQRG
ncbi:MAG: nuclear transport factor 2 family protein [Acidimicrobiia bacterium]